MTLLRGSAPGSSAQQPLGAPTMAFQLVEDILVVVHADMPPSAEDWQAMILERDRSPGLKGQLIIAPPRATIDVRQRGDVKSFLQATGTRLAVLTDSRLAQGAAIAVAWFGFAVCALPRDRFEEAMRHLHVAPERQEALRQAALALAAEVHVGVPLRRTGS